MLLRWVVPDAIRYRLSTNDEYVSIKCPATYMLYRNTLADMLKVPVDDPKSLCFRICFYMVDRRGIEPRLQACKAHVLPLSLSAHYWNTLEPFFSAVDTISHSKRAVGMCFNNGSPTWDRTRDQQINSLLLYRWAIGEYCFSTLPLTPLIWSLDSKYLSCLFIMDSNVLKE